MSAAAQRLRRAIGEARETGTIAELPYQETLQALEQSDVVFYSMFPAQYNSLLNLNYETLGEFVEAMNDPASILGLPAELRIALNNHFNLESITDAARKFYSSTKGEDDGEFDSGGSGGRGRSRSRSRSTGSKGSRGRSGSASGRGRSGSGDHRSGGSGGRKSKKSKKSKKGSGRGVQFPSGMSADPGAPLIAKLAGYLYYLHWKRGQKIWSRRWFEFEDGEVRMFKRKGTSKFRAFPVLGAKVRLDPLGNVDPKHSLQFYLKLDEGGLTKIYFRTADMGELKMWVYGLREVTGDNFGPDPFKCRNKYGKYTYDGKVFSEDNISDSPSLMDDAVPWFAQIGVWCDHFLSLKFAWWGGFMARHPIAVIIVSGFLAGLFTSFWVLQEAEFAPIKVWVPQDSVAKLHDGIVKENFPSGPRVNTLILRVQGDSLVSETDILTSEYVTAAYELHNKIMNLCVTIKGVDYCYQDSTDPVRPEGLCFRPILGRCFNVTIFEFWNDDPDEINGDISNTQLIKRKLSDTHATYQGKPLNPESLLGGVKRSEPLRDVESATAIIHSYFLNFTNYDDVKGEDPPFFSVQWIWEQAFLDLLTDPTQPHFDTFRIERNAGITVSIELSKAMSDSYSLLAVGITAMITFVMLTLGQRDRVYGRMALGLSGIGDTMSSVGISNGFGSLIGIVYTPPVSVVPFIVLGIGVDDMFILVDTYDRSNPAKSIEGRFRQTLMESGIAILTTSMTDFLAFVIGAGTALPAIESFCWYAGFAVMGDFLMQITFFSSMMVMDTRRQKANRFDLLPCVKSKRPPKDSHVDDDFNKSWLASKYGPFLMTPCVKILVVGGFTVLFLFFLNGALQLEQEFKTEELAADDSYFQTFIKENDFFWPTPEIGFSVNWYLMEGDEPEQDYKLEATHRGIEDLGEKTRDLSFMKDASADMWHKQYLSWLAIPDTGQGAEHNHDSQLDGTYPPDDKFIDWMDQPGEWYEVPRGALYPPKIVHYPPGQTPPQKSGAVERDIKMCYITSTAIDIYDSQDQVEGMAIAREFGASHPMQTFPYSGIYVVNEQFAVIMQEAINNVVIALIVVFAVTIIMLIDPRAAFITTAVIFIVDMDLLGWTFYNGLTITGLTTTNIVIAIGLAVDYAVHVAHGFMSAGGNRNQRSIRAIATMGASVVSGAFSTWIAISPLTFAASSIFRTFFTMFGGTLILGTTHGMILLPVIMSWYGPPAVPHVHDDEEEEEFDHMKAMNKQVNYKNNENAMEKRKTKMRMTMGFTV